MSPELVIETVAQHFGNRRIFRDPKPLMPIIGLFRDAVMFDIGELRPAPEHGAFAADLLTRGLFELPYPVTAIRFTGEARQHGHQRGHGMMVLARGRQGLTGVHCGPSPGGLGRSPGAIPIGTVIAESFQIANPESVDIIQNSYPLVTDEVIAAMYPGGQLAAEQAWVSTMFTAIGAVVMLMSRGVETKHVPAPVKLNKQREAKGKPPIGERYTVHIAAGDIRTVTLEDGSDESIAGHERGSPRAHWRRGHFRTLYRGTDHERVVPVAPALIGANELADGIRAKVYAVKAGRAA